MLKRHARLRKEYLYRKSLEGKERELYEKKRKIRQALEGEGFPCMLACNVIGNGRLMGSCSEVCLHLFQYQVRPGPPGCAEGKPIPTELRREEAELRHQVELEDDNTAVPRTHVDDEYAYAGEKDPKVLITTSRDPSSRLVQFAKELKLLFPNSQRINRGGQV